MGEEGKSGTNLCENLVTKNPDFLPETEYSFKRHKEHFPYRNIYNQ